MSMTKFLRVCDFTTYELINLHNASVKVTVENRTATIYVNNEIVTAYEFEDYDTALVFKFNLINALEFYIMKDGSPRDEIAKRSTLVYDDTSLFDVSIFYYKFMVGHKMWKKDMEEKQAIYKEE